MSKKSSLSAVALPDEDQDTLVFEDADDFPSRQPAAPMEDFDKAQAELNQLRQRQEELQRHQQHLEEVRKKQEAFANGKREIMEKLNRSVLTIERDLYNTQKLMEEFNSTHASFSGHLDVLRNLQPEKWPRTQVDEHLNHALDAIADAKDDFAKSTRRLSSLRPEISGGQAEHGGGARAVEDEDFLALVKRGFALSLPLIAAGLIGLVLAKIMF